MQIGETKMRYPGNDPENGPAYMQRWDGKTWNCAEHKFKMFVCDDIGDDNKPTGDTYIEHACVYCGYLYCGLEQD